MHTPDIHIETERLVLRLPMAADFDGYARLMAQESSARYIGGVQSRPIAWRSFMTHAGAWMIDGVAMFSVIEKSSGQWIGRIGPWRPEGWPGTEVGWALLPEAWGRGYATEAATASIDYAFEQLGWAEVIHSIDPANTASQRVAERLGSRWLRKASLPLPGGDEPIDIWGQSRGEWLARKARNRV